MPYFVTGENEAEGCSGYAVVKEDGEVIGCHTTKTAAIDQMVAVSIAEDMEPGGEYGDRVAPDALDIGDFVSWNAAGGRARGQVERIVRDGSLNVPDSDFTINGDEEDPAALIRVWRPVEGGWRETDRRVGHRFSTLTKIAPLPEAEEDRQLPDNYRPALESDVPEGRACGNCYFYDDDVRQGDMALCRRWLEYVRGDHYCNAWQPDDLIDEPDFDDDLMIDLDKDLRAENIPQYIRDAAERGLELRREGFGGDGLTDQTIREARAMARGEMTDDKVVRANAWAARHAVDLEAEQNTNPDADGWPGNGAVAHYLWGINPLDPEPARRWLEREVARIRDERNQMSNVEIRTFDASICEMRAAEDGNGMTFGGYAWRYNEPSLPLPFTERIAPGAFTRTLKSKNDIRAYVNHDDTRLLGSTRAKTLRIEDRPEGGYVEIDLPDTTDGRDMRTLVARGDITGMSFGFSTVKDSWSSDGNERTLLEVRLHEVSIVTSQPAYPQTTASVRNLKVIAKRSQTDADQLAEAISALEAGELNEDQAAILRKVVDNAAGIDTATPEPTVPLSVLMKQLDLLSKAL